MKTCDSPNLIASLFWRQPKYTGHVGIVLAGGAMLNLEEWKYPRTYLAQVE